METQRQGNLFDGDPDARECAACGESFVPDFNSHKPRYMTIVGRVFKIERA
jgi:hypothetical protein